MEVMRRVWLPYVAKSYTCPKCGRTTRDQRMIRRLGCRERDCLPPNLISEYVEWAWDEEEHQDGAQLARDNGLIYARAWSPQQRMYLLQQCDEEYALMVGWPSGMGPRVEGTYLYDHLALALYAAMKTQDDQEPKGWRAKEMPPASSQTRTIGPVLCGATSLLPACG
jgi:hypothetical protein